MTRYCIPTIALIVLSAQLYADEFEYDSRHVYDLCAPDQIESSEGVQFDWGHYRQWTAHAGTASGKGSFLAAPWNTCCLSPLFRELQFEGQGELKFFVRTAHDGSPPGRNLPGQWSEWEMLTRKRIESDPEIKHIYEYYIVNFRRRAGFDAIRDNTNAFAVAQHWISLGIAWSLSQDAVFLEEAKHQLDRFAQRQARETIDVAMAGPDHWSVAQLWKAVLWYDPEIPVATDFVYPQSMPLGRHLEGVGQVVSRSGWNNDDVVAIFKSGRAYTPGTHYHADENSFVIDRAGSLAIDSGSDDRDSSHYSSYFTRSVAHNTITLTQPGEVFALGPGNDGGQIGGSWVRTLQSDGSLDSAQYGALIREPLGLDGIIAFETAADFTCAAGDATKAHSSDKVSLFTRQFLHVRPGCIVIFDRVTSTDAALEKRWLLHTIDEPTIDQHLATVTHQQGRLFCQTLLPIQSRTAKVGGSVGAHIQLHSGDGKIKLDQPLTTLVVPQRFDTEEIWK